MEPFFDGGLFELLIAIGIGSSLNFIFKRKYLLIIYSVASIMATMFLLFTKKGEIYQWLVAVNAFNTILLIALLWKQKLTEPNKSLIDTDKYIDLYLKRKEEIKRILNISED
jgi:hypothetical protein